jgi:pimeloyl-ACP methyl ester carboxylesterase
VNRKIVSLAVVGITALAGVVATSQASVAATGAQHAKATSAERWAATLPAPKPINWGKCADPGLAHAGAKCGFLVVPLNWNKPNGSTIKIAVSRVLHTSSTADYQGIMLVNPGGPGGSGLGLSTLGSAVPNNAGADYDWIGFDPRGVGDSQPHLSCIPSYMSGPRPEYIPETQQLANTWLNRSKTYADACGVSSARSLLPYMRTEDVAKDMDYLRAALGQSQLNYYGFSYGTYLGQVYSSLFPSHVRRMVFDSTVDPRGFWYQDNLDQDVAFDRNVKIWFGWVAKYNNVYHLGKTAADVKTVWYSTKFALAKKPAGGVVGADEWNDIFLYAGYYQEYWTFLGAVFANWVNHKDLADLKYAYNVLVGPSDDNGFAVYLGVQCTDAPAPTSWQTWQTDNWQVFQQAPFETWDNAWFNGPCLYWNTPAQPAVHIDGSQVSSLLMIDQTLDAATPYPGSLYVRSIYPNASLIAEPGGTTHADTLSGNACVDDQIAAYIANGTLPARKPGNGPDTTCAPLPRPVPQGPAAAKRQITQMSPLRKAIIQANVPVTR